MGVHKGSKFSFLDFVKILTGRSGFLAPILFIVPCSKIELKKTTLLPPTKTAHDHEMGFE